ncbi:MAG: aldehyde dehydrogenase family protein [Pirellulales bacterium]|nr:aldehyde dehydrogenase [Rhodopirellula sp.]MCH2371074.1 aldehyde dehydrogenase family protein [Pirellulales bacterium]
MVNIPVIRWGEEYESLETQELVHHATGDIIGTQSMANGGLITRDMRKAQQARDILKQFSIEELVEKMGKAGDLFVNGNLSIGDSEQTPQDFIVQQSATTGLPEHMVELGMSKNAFVMNNMGRIIDALTRGLPLDILSSGWGKEARGIPVSYQCQTPILAAVLPSNSPGVHTLWLPAVPLQIGLVLKPGQKEPWTPYRMFAAMVAAGIPKEIWCLYPGSGAEIGSAVLSKCKRSMIFGSKQTVDNYKGNPQVQAHGPGFSKILIGDDCVDNWEEYIDLIVESIYINGGRGCINTSSIWASRHTEEIAQALAEKLGPIEALPPTDPKAGLAAFTIDGMATAIWDSIKDDLDEDGVTHVTGQYGDRLIEKELCGYIRPTIVHCKSPENAIAQKEYMFPFASVVECPEDKMLGTIGETLVCTGITNNESLRNQLIDCTEIDRLNLGPVPTTKLNWLQPHEGNIIDFLFRNRAFQVPEELL